MLLDGQQLGPVCKVVPLPPLRSTASHTHAAAAAAAADPTRPQSPQVSFPLHLCLRLPKPCSNMGTLISQADE